MKQMTDRLASIHAGFRGCDTTAAVHRGAKVSFATLYTQSCALAQSLSKSRAPVLIYGHKSPQYLTAIWACLLTARAYVPIEPEIPSDQIKAIAASCGSDIVLTTEPDQTVTIPNGITLPIDGFQGHQDGFAPLPRNSRDTAYILYSSGTTGAPKGIQVAYNNLVHFVDWLETDVLAQESSTAVTGNVRYCFDVSMFELWYSWLARATLSVLDNADFSNSRLSIGRYRDDGVGIWVSTPSTMQLYLRDKTFNAATLPKLKTFLFCGEVLAKSTVATLFDRFPDARVINTYGPTECTVAVSAADIRPADVQHNDPLPIGRPRQGCSLSVQDGQIVIAGQQVVGLGYLGLPEKTASAFPTPTTYLTGDIGYSRADGQWMFSGRADREIKVQGVRVDLNEIEAALHNLPGIETAHVAPHAVRSKIRAMNAYVCGPASVEELNSAANTMARTFPPWMIPRFWYACPDFPINRNSKLDRTDFMRGAEAEGITYVYS